MNCKAEEPGGCLKFAIAQGFCGTHYQRWRRNGDPMLVKPNPGNRTPRPVVTWRKCRGCGYEGPVSDFMPKRNLCVPCNTQRLAEWKAEHPEQAKSIKQACATRSEFRRAAKRLGLDPDRMERLRAAHDGKCDICRRVPAGGERRLHMDHDHATGEFRGFLCNNCNAGLGRFKDNPARIRAAADYLERVTPASLYRRDLQLR